MRRSPLTRRTPLRPWSKKRRQAAKQYRNARAVAFHRAQERCEVCGQRAEHAHHLLPRSAGGPDDPTNLLAVCHACHARIHANPQWAREHGYLRSRWAA